MGLKLTEIYKKLLQEQMPMAPMGGMGAMGMGMGMMQRPLGSNLGSAAMMSQPGANPQTSGKNIVELTDVNTVVSMFPMEKKLVFSPQEHTSYTGKMKLYVDVLKQNFMIDSINHLDEGVFELVLDPRENFESVVQFLQPAGGPNVQQG